MALNDSLSDMLARIKNAHQAKKVSTLCLKSKLNINVLNVLKDEGYIRDFQNIEERKGVISTSDYVNKFDLDRNKIEDYKDDIVSTCHKKPSEYDFLIELQIGSNG